MRLVAVVLSYNNENYLNDCLSSIINQTQPPDLILFCDDGSTDGSVALANGILSRAGLDFNILRRPSNCGTLINLLSVTPFVDVDDILVLCDADDVSFSNRFEVIFSRFGDSALDGYGHAAEVIDSNGHVVNEFYMQNRLAYLPGLRDHVFLYELHGACLAVRGKFILALPAPIHRELFQDVFFAFFASIYESTFIVEPIKLVSYRRHENANSNCGTRKNYSGFIIDESKSRDNSLRLYNLHVWLEWYIEASGFMREGAGIIYSHFERAKEMHFLKYNYDRQGFLKKLGTFGRAFLSGSPAWRWFLYRIFGIKYYFWLLSLRSAWVGKMNRIGSRKDRLY